MDSRTHHNRVLFSWLYIGWLCWEVSGQLLTRGDGDTWFGTTYSQTSPLNAPSGTLTTGDSASDLDKRDIIFFPGLMMMATRQSLVVKYQTTAIIHFEYKVPDASSMISRFQKDLDQASSVWQGNLGYCTGFRQEMMATINALSAAFIEKSVMFAKLIPDLNLESSGPSTFGCGGLLGFVTSILSGGCGDDNSEAIKNVISQLKETNDRVAKNAEGITMLGQSIADLNNRTASQFTFLAGEISNLENRTAQRLSDLKDEISGLSQNDTCKFMVRDMMQIWITRVNQIFFELLITVMNRLLAIDIIKRIAYAPVSGAITVSDFPDSARDAVLESLKKECRETGMCPSFNADTKHIIDMVMINHRVSKTQDQYIITAEIPMSSSAPTQAVFQMNVLYKLLPDGTCVSGDERLSEMYSLLIIETISASENKYRFILNSELKKCRDTGKVLSCPDHMGYTPHEDWMDIKPGFQRNTNGTNRVVYHNKCNPFPIVHIGDSAYFVQVDVQLTIHDSTGVARETRSYQVGSIAQLKCGFYYSFMFDGFKHNARATKSCIKDVGPTRIPVMVPDTPGTNFHQLEVAGAQRVTEGLLAIDQSKAAAQEFRSQQNALAATVAEKTQSLLASNNESSVAINQAVVTTQIAAAQTIEQSHAANAKLDSIASTVSTNSGSSDPKVWAALIMSAIALACILYLMIDKFRTSGMTSVTHDIEKVIEHSEEKSAAPPEHDHSSEAIIGQHAYLMPLLKTSPTVLKRLNVLVLFGIVKGSNFTDYDCFKVGPFTVWDQLMIFVSVLLGLCTCLVLLVKLVQHSLTYRRKYKPQTREETSSYLNPGFAFCPKAVGPLNRVNFFIIFLLFPQLALNLTIKEEIMIWKSKSVKDVTLSFKLMSDDHQQDMDRALTNLNFTGTPLCMFNNITAWGTVPNCSYHVNFTQCLQMSCVGDPNIWSNCLKQACSKAFFTDMTQTCKMFNNLHTVPEPGNTFATDHLIETDTPWKDRSAVCYPASNQLGCEWGDASGQSNCINWFLEHFLRLNYTDDRDTLVRIENMRYTYTQKYQTAITATIIKDEYFNASLISKSADFLKGENQSLRISYPSSLILNVSNLYRWVDERSLLSCFFSQSKHWCQSVDSILASVVCPTRENILCGLTKSNASNVGADYVYLHDETAIVGKGHRISFNTTPQITTVSLDIVGVRSPEGKFQLDNYTVLTRMSDMPDSFPIYLRDITPVFPSQNGTSNVTSGCQNSINESWSSLIVAVITGWFVYFFCYWFRMNAPTPIAHSFNFWPPELKSKSMTLFIFLNLLLCIKGEKLIISDGSLATVEKSVQILRFTADQSARLSEQLKYIITDGILCEFPTFIPTIPWDKCPYQFYRCFDQSVYRRQCIFNLNDALNCLGKICIDHHDKVNYCKIHQSLAFAGDQTWANYALHNSDLYNIAEGLLSKTQCSAGKFHIQSGFWNIDNRSDPITSKLIETATEGSPFVSVENLALLGTKTFNPIVLVRMHKLNGKEYELMKQDDIISSFRQLSTVYKYSQQFYVRDGMTSYAVADSELSHCLFNYTTHSYKCLQSPLAENQCRSRHSVLCYIQTTKQTGLTPSPHGFQLLFASKGSSYVVKDSMGVTVHSEILHDDVAFDCKSDTDVYIENKLEICNTRTATSHMWYFLPPENKTEVAKTTQHNTVISSTSSQKPTTNEPNSGNQVESVFLSALKSTTKNMKALSNHLKNSLCCKYPDCSRQRQWSYCIDCSSTPNCSIPKKNKRGVLSPCNIPATCSSLTNLDYCLSHYRTYCSIQLSAFYTNLGCSCISHGDFSTSASIAALIDRCLHDASCSFHQAPQTTISPVGHFNVPNLNHEPPISQTHAPESCPIKQTYTTSEYVADMIHMSIQMNQKECQDKVSIYFKTLHKLGAECGVAPGCFSSYSEYQLCESKALGCTSIYLDRSTVTSPVLFAATSNSPLQTVTVEESWLDKYKQYEAWIIASSTSIAGALLAGLAFAIYRYFRKSRGPPAIVYTDHLHFSSFDEFRQVCNSSWQTVVALHLPYETITAGGQNGTLNVYLFLGNSPSHKDQLRVAGKVDVVAMTKSPKLLVRITSETRHISFIKRDMEVDTSTFINYYHKDTLGSSLGKLQADRNVVLLDKNSHVKLCEDMQVRFSEQTGKGKTPSKHLENHKAKYSREEDQDAIAEKVVTKGNENKPGKKYKIEVKEPHKMDNNQKAIFDHLVNKTKSAAQKKGVFLQPGFEFGTRFLHMWADVAGRQLKDSVDYVPDKDTRVQLQAKAIKSYLK